MRFFPDGMQKPGIEQLILPVSAWSNKGCRMEEKKRQQDALL